MKNIKKLSLMALAAMAIFSLTNLFGLSLAGLTVIIGVVFFFLENGKVPAAQTGFDI